MICGCTVTYHRLTRAAAAESGPRLVDWMGRNADARAAEASVQSDAQGSIGSACVARAGLRCAVVCHDGLLRRCRPGWPESPVCHLCVASACQEGQGVRIDGVGPGSIWIDPRSPRSIRSNRIGHGVQISNAEVESRGWGPSRLGGTRGDGPQNRSLVRLTERWLNLRMGRRLFPARRQAS